MGSAKYRHRIDIQSAVSAVDAYGEATLTWSTLIECMPAAKDVGNATETTVGGQTKTVRPVVFTTRYDERITTGNRIQHGGETYEIKDVRDRFGKCEELEITATLLKC